jgi:excisionase family DNA binding protein
MTPRATVPAPGRRGLLSIDEAAEQLGISSGTMRNWVSVWRIGHVKVGRLTRVRPPILPGIRPSVVCQPLTIYPNGECLNLRR